MLADDELVHFYLAAVAQLEGEIAVLGVIVPGRRWIFHCRCVGSVVWRPVGKKWETLGEVTALM